MRERLREFIRFPSQGEYLEIRLEKRFFTLIRIQNGLVEKIRQGVEEGGYVRVLNPRTGWWFTTFSGWENLKERVEESLRSSSLLPRSNTGVVYGEPVEEVIVVPMADDFRFKLLKDKVDVLLGYAQILKDTSPSLASFTVEYRDEWREIHIANSDGSILSIEKPDVSLKFIAVAKKGDTIEMYQNGLAEKGGFEVVRGQENLAQEVAQKALALLEAPPFEGGVYDVILDPVLAGVFIHEAFGHLSEADFLSRNERLQKMMVLGKEVATPVLNVFDDGNIPELRGSSTYDDEGTKTQRTYLIRDGLLTGRLHSRETAYLMKENPTGNARTVSYRFPPLVRMSNTGIEEGRVSKEDLFKDVERGLYAVEYIGGNTALELFTFSAAYGHRIEKGRVGEMVKDVVLSGNLFRTLKKIDAVASDFRWTQVGGCGKGSQTGLPTPTGSPHVRLREILVGGTNMFEVMGIIKKSWLQGDLFLWKAQEKSVEYEAGVFKGYKTEEATGYGLRVIRQDGRMGFYASNGPLEGRELVEKALEMSEFGEKALFEIPSYPSVLEWKNFVDPKVEHIEVREMVELGEYIVTRIREEYPEVLVNLEIVAGLEERSLYNHHEEKLDFARTSFQIAVSVNRTAEDDILEIYAERSWGSRDVDVEDLLQELKRKIEFSKHLISMGSGRYPVIFTPQGALVLLYPLLYGLNGKNILFGRSPLKDRFGKVVFSSLFSLIEVSHEPWTLGSCPFDDEGVVTQKEQFIVENGKLENGFFDLWSAARLGRVPGGHGFRAFYHELPEPGFGALRVKNGLRDRETLVEELEEGLIVDSVLGLGQSNVASGAFSCGIQLGFYVKGGEIQGRVKDVMVSGNVYHALQNIKELSRDDRWIYGKMLLPYILVEPLEIET